jgi:hypothetical protein
MHDISSPPKPPRPASLTPSVPDIKPHRALPPPPPSHHISSPIPESPQEVNVNKVSTHKNRVLSKSNIGIITAVIMAVAALISSLAAWRKSPEEPAAKLGYEVLQQAYLSTQEDIKELRKVQEDQTKAFQEYVKAKEGEDNIITEPSTPDQVMPALRVQVQPTRRLIPVVRRNGDVVGTMTATAEKKEIFLPSTKAVTVSKSIPNFDALQVTPAASSRPALVK